MLDFHKENTVLLKKKLQGILPTCMLAYLDINNSFVYNVYMDDIVNIICQIHHLHLETYFIQQQHDFNSDIYGRINVSLLQLIYKLWGMEHIQNYMSDNPEYNKISIDRYYQEIFRHLC